MRRRKKSQIIKSCSSMMIKIDLKSITMRCKKKCPMKIDEHELFEETHRKSDNRTKKEEKKD